MFLRGIHERTLFFNTEPVNSFESLSSKNGGVPRNSAHTTSVNLFSRYVVTFVSFSILIHYVSVSTPSHPVTPSCSVTTNRSSATPKRTRRLPPPAHQLRPHHELLRLNRCFNPPHSTLLHPLRPRLRQFKQIRSPRNCWTR
jgi:hypothetical protein